MVANFPNIDLTLLLWLVLGLQGASLYSDSPVNVAKTTPAVLLKLQANEGRQPRNCIFIIYQSLLRQVSYLIRWTFNTSKPASAWQLASLRGANDEN